MTDRDDPRYDCDCGAQFREAEEYVAHREREHGETWPEEWWEKEQE